MSSRKLNPLLKEFSTYLTEQEAKSKKTAELYSSDLISLSEKKYKEYDSLVQGIEKKLV